MWVAVVACKPKDIERHLAGPTERTKGIAPVHGSTSYFMRFIRQIERVVTGTCSDGGEALRGWVDVVATYEIVR